jgi:hypothetical protein
MTWHHAIVEPSRWPWLKAAALYCLLLQTLTLILVWPRIGAHTGVNFYWLMLPFALVMLAALIFRRQAMAWPALIFGAIGACTPLYVEHTGLQWRYGVWLAAGLPEDPPHAWALWAWLTLIVSQWIALVVVWWRARKTEC